MNENKKIQAIEKIRTKEGTKEWRNEGLREWRNEGMKRTYSQGESAGGPIGTPFL